MGTKISQLGTATTITASDLMQVVDFEDKAMAATGTNKKITAQTLANELGKLTSFAVVSANNKQLGDALNKANNGNNITVAFYGTSITYGQDTSASGVDTQINGASQKRSPTPFPEKFQEASALCGFSGSITVFNRGFPGDSTIEGLSRWLNSSATDISFIEYGHNDALNYGGYPHGIVSIVDYRKNLSLIIEREIAKGAAVVILGSTPVNSVSQNNSIRSYAYTAKQIANQYGLPFVDLEELINTVNDKWTDNVHLSPKAYNEIGWNLSSLLVRRDGAIRTVTSGDIFYATDFLGHGGSQYTWENSKSGTSSLIALGAGFTYAIGVYCAENVVPVIKTVNETALSFTLNSYYSGASFNSTCGLVHDPAYGNRQAFKGHILSKGYRMLAIRNDGANAAFIESIEFEDVNTAHCTRGLLSKLPSMTGVFQPSRISNAQVNWFCVSDVSKKLTSPCSIISYVTLTDTGFNGIAINKNRPSSSSSEIISPDSLLVLRNGTSLVLRELIAGAVNSEVTFTSKFSTGVFTGEIEVVLSSGTLSAYVNGTLAGSLAVAQTLGYAGMIGFKTQRFVCNGMYISGEVKSIY
jgi:lysophospholipase L1-like esterase